MDNVLGTLFQDIADAIRGKTGSTDTMSPAEFPTKIGEIDVGSGGGGDFDTSDGLLKYFTYCIDGETKTITLYSILYDVLYKDTGSYDVAIPDTIGGYAVVVKNV